MAAARVLLLSLLVTLSLGSEDVSDKDEENLDLDNELAVKDHEDLVNERNEEIKKTTQQFASLVEQLFNSNKKQPQSNWNFVKDFILPHAKVQENKWGSNWGNHWGNNWGFWNQFSNPGQWNHDYSWNGQLGFNEKSDDEETSPMMTIYHR